MEYDELEFKIPQENQDYPECSEFVTSSVESILQEAVEEDRNKIVINTNLKLGLPMENINKIAGPFVEAWALQTFHDVVKCQENKYQLINVQALERLHRADIILQFRKRRRGELGVTAEIDVKATAEDIESSGKSPNITSFGRIRSAYVEDADYIFVILSFKHRVYSSRNPTSGLIDGIMEVVAYNAYDLKYLSSADFNYNPALGTGQIQVKDIHYVSLERRTTWEFCQLLDRKYLSSTKKTFQDWLDLAIRHGWIKHDG